MVTKFNFGIFDSMALVMVIGKPFLLPLELWLMGEESSLELPYEGSQWLTAGCFLI